MVICEFYATRRDGVHLFRSASDRGVMIRKVGTDELYAEAIDVEGIGYTYEETEIPIEKEDENDDV